MSCLFPPVCAFCAHILNQPDQECRAFHEIPEDIMLGNNDHVDAIEGDGGYRFQLNQDDLEAFQEVNNIRQAMDLRTYRMGCDFLQSKPHCSKT